MISTLHIIHPLHCVLFQFLLKSFLDFSGVIANNKLLICFFFLNLALQQKNCNIFTCASWVFFHYCCRLRLNRNANTHTHRSSRATRRRGGWLIRLAPLFHLTEQKGSRLCQIASQHGKRESARLMRALSPLTVKGMDRLSVSFSNYHNCPQGAC